MVAQNRSEPVPAVHLFGAAVSSSAALPGRHVVLLALISMQCLEMISFTAAE